MLENYYYKNYGNEDDDDDDDDYEYCNYHCYCWIKFHNVASAKPNKKVSPPPPIKIA